MAKYKILLLGDFWQDTNIERKILNEINGEPIVDTGENESSYSQLLGEVDAIIQGSFPVTDAFLSKAKKCKIVAGLGVGYDNVDIVAAAKYGIYISNMPAQYWCADEVSDHAVALGLAVRRKVSYLNQITKNGGWREKLKTAGPIHSLRGQTWGLYACGHIARATALKVKVFGFHVIAFDPFVSVEEAHQYGIELVDFNTLLKESDIISIHAPLLKSTYHQFNAEAFQKMKRTACLVNVARGPIVDQNALYHALNKNIISAAGIDVLENEPPDLNDPLLTLDDIKLTLSPHMASDAEESFEKSRKGSCEEVVKVLKGEQPRSWVNRKEMHEFKKERK